MSSNERDAPLSEQRLSPESAGSQSLRDALRVAVPVESDEAIGARRERLVGVIEREICRVPHQLAKREARARLGTAARFGAAAAAIVCLVGGGAYLLSTDWASGGPAGYSAKVEANAKQTASRSLYVGRLLETGPAEEQTYVLAGETELAMKELTRLRVAEDTEGEQAFQLGRGGIVVAVPHREMARSVRVVTPHATIFVKGTVFSVDVEPNDSQGRESTTEVEVTRGQVLVEFPSGQVLLSPGESWKSSELDAVNARTVRESTKAPVGSQDDPSKSRVGATANPRSGDEPQSPPGGTNANDEIGTQVSVDAPGAINEHRAIEGSDERTSTHAAGRSESAEATARSTLARQNALLEAALRAEKRGDLTRAGELVDRLLVDYPESPLRASAQAVKKRLRD